MYAHEPEEATKVRRVGVAGGVHCQLFGVHCALCSVRCVCVVGGGGTRAQLCYYGVLVAGGT